MSPVSTKRVHVVEAAFVIWLRAILCSSAEISTITDISRKRSLKRGRHSSSRVQNNLKSKANQRTYASVVKGPTSRSGVPTQDRQGSCPKCETQACGKERSGTYEVFLLNALCLNVLARLQLTQNRVIFHVFDRYIVICNIMILHATVPVTYVHL